MALRLTILGLSAVLYVLAFLLPGSGLRIESQRVEVKGAVTLGLALFWLKKGLWFAWIGTPMLLAHVLYVAGAVCVLAGWSLAARVLGSGALALGLVAIALHAVLPDLPLYAAYYVWSGSFGLLVFAAVGGPVRAAKRE